MEKMVKRQRVTSVKPYNYVFDQKIPPKIRVKLGEEFEVETEDAISGHLRKPEDYAKIGKTLEFTRMPSETNPINGPVYIEGVEPRDVLLVDILDIVPAEFGWTCVVPDFGPLKYDARWPKCHGPSVRFIKHLPGPSGTTSDGKAQFPRDDPSKPPFEWNLAPFFGTIGVAPDREAISSITGPYVAVKGAWGGNWDARDVKKDTKLWLQAYHKGGLFFVGDLHASQGDGEWTGVANESPGLGVFKCEVLKNTRISYPRIEKKDSIVQLNSGRSLDRALEEATTWLMEWLVKDYGFDQLECYNFLSSCPDFRYNIYQMISPDHYTVGVEIPKKYLSC